MIDLGELIVDLSILGVYPAQGGGGGGSVTNVGTGTGLTGGPITGSGVISFADASTLTVLANITGGTAPPIPNTISDILDATFDNSQGDILYRGASGWTYLAPSTAGYFLQTGGPAADPTWAAGAVGTVTQVNSGLGLTGGPITGSGTLSLANIAVGDVLANVGGFSAAPNAVTVTDLFDFVFGQSQGQLLYRGASVWEPLTPSTAGYILQTGGLSANPSWVPNEGLAAINDGDLLANTSGSSAIPVDTSLTTLLDYVFGSSQGDILYRGASAWEVLTPSTAGYLLQTGGPAVDPSWAPPPTGGSPYYLDPVLDVLDNSLTPVTVTYYNGPGNDGIGATLTNAGALAAFMADGDTPPVGSSILVVNMGNSAYNGIYVLTVAGDGATAWILERRADFNQTSNIFDGIWVAVFGGNSYNYLYSAWLLSSGNEPPVPYNVGTDALYFTQTSTHSVNGFVAGDTSTVNYTNYGPGGISAPPGTTLTLSCSSGGAIALFTDTIQLESNIIVAGTGTGPAVISYAAASNNNITFDIGTQTFNIGGVAQISLSTSGAQIGSGATVTSISTDGTFAGAVDTTLSTSLAIKTYVDAIPTGGSPFYLDPVLDVLNANLQTIVCTYYNGAGNDGIGATLTNNDGLFTVFTADGDTPPVGSSILVVNSYASNTSTGNDAWNGIYVLTVAGDGVSVNWVLERRADCNQTSNIINGISVFVFGVYSNNYPLTSFIMNSGVEPFVPLVIGTDGIYFNQSAYGNHFTEGLTVGNTATPAYLALGGNTIFSSLGGNVNIAANSGGSVQLETNSIVVGTGFPNAVISYQTDLTNNLTISTGTQTFNIGGVAQISLSTSGVQIGSGATVTTISTDGTFAGAVDTTLSTSLAIKTYVDAQIGGSGAVNPGLTNELAYYAAAGDAVSGLTTANSSVCVTDSGGVPSFSTTLPNSIDLGIPSALDATNATGTAAGLTAGTVTTNANLTGDVTSSGNATTLTNSAVTSQALTGYSISSGTVLATDSILQAIEKIAGNAGGGGTVLSVQTFTSGSGTYTPTAGANYIWVRAVGGGGGGGGAAAATGSYGVGMSSGGSSGCYGEYVGAATAIAYSIGAAGSAGSAGYNTGGNGGATTFGTAGAILNLSGGTGGYSGSGYGLNLGGAINGAAPSTGTGGSGTLIIGGNGGTSGWCTTGGPNNGIMTSGAGGSNPLGVGGTGNSAQITSSGVVLAVAGAGYGAGGSGTAIVSTPTANNQAGAAGAPGVIIITEYA